MDITTTCPNVTRSRFFTLPLQYLYSFNSNKADIVRKIYKLPCPTRHKISLFFYNFIIKTKPMTESRKIDIGFECMMCK